MRLPRFHRLHIFFTGPFVLAGLLSILTVSIIASNAARSVMGLMAQDLAAESLDGLRNRLQNSDFKDQAADSIDALLKEHFSNKNSYGYVSDGSGRLLGTSWIAMTNGLGSSADFYPNGFNHPDCLIRCSLRGAQDQFGHIEQLAARSYVVAGDEGILHVAMQKLANSGSPGLVAFAVIPEQVYFAYIRDVIKAVFWAALAIIGFLLVGGFLASLLVTTPILKLNESLKRVGRGHWDEIILLDRDDEIGELSQSFHQMATRLRDLVRNLEGLVEERTIDLKDLLEKYAQANRELEKTNATKDRFFSIIAHDLKSPFTALKGYSGIIQDSFESLSRDQLRSMINRISVSSEEAYGLLENLLQWALVQSGEIRVKWEIFDAREVVLEVFDLLKVNAKVKNVSLNNLVNEAFWIQADRNMLGTVLRNIVSNSIKFTRSEEGKVTITSLLNDEGSSLIIEDNGVGIKRENLKKLFEKDIYFSEKGTSNEGGTGLGLGLCKEFVTMNRGRIEVESELGQGTRFTTLWRTASSPNRESNPSEECQPLRILCVDDSEDNHNLLSIFLKDQAWQLDFTLSGAGALEIIKENSYDIILMDLNMPGLSGVETTYELRRFESHSNRSAAYIIAFTSSVLQADIDAAIAAGCDSYLVKPVKKQKLISAIARHERKVL